MKEYIFLGYGIGEYGYRLWDPVQKKIVWSRDVVFFEDENIEDISRTEPTPTIEAPVDLSPMAIDQGGIPPQQEEAVPEPEEPVPESEEQPLRRTARERQPSQRYPVHEYVLLTDGEATERKDKEHWMTAMEEEMESLRQNKAFDLVQLPKGRKALRNEWACKLKTDADKSGQMKRHCRTKLLFFFLRRILHHARIRIRMTSADDVISSSSSRRVAHAFRRRLLSFSGDDGKSRSEIRFDAEKKGKIKPCNFGSKDGRPSPPIVSNPLPIKTDDLLLLKPIPIHEEAPL